MSEPNNITDLVISLSVRIRELEVDLSLARYEADELKKKLAEVKGGRNEW
jgi:hypothetical protein